MRRCRHQLLKPLTTRHNFAPDFGRQTQCACRGFVPFATLGNIVNPNFNFGWQRQIAAVFHSGINVAFDVLAQQFQRPRFIHSRFLEQERQNRVLRDVAGDVFFGVIRAHLPLIDELLEDITQHIGVDFVTGFGRALIELPLPFAEERENLFKRLVGNGDFAAFPIASARISVSPMK